MIGVHLISSFAISCFEYIHIIFALPQSVKSAIVEYIIPRAVFRTQTTELKPGLTLKLKGDGAFNWLSTHISRRRN